jgi:hypothetical protein
MCGHRRARVPPLKFIFLCNPPGHYCLFQNSCQETKRLSSRSNNKHYQFGFIYPCFGKQRFRRRVCAGSVTAMASPVPGCRSNCRDAWPGFQPVLNSWFQPTAKNACWQALCKPGKCKPESFHHDQRLKRLVPNGHQAIVKCATCNVKPERLSRWHALRSPVSSFPSHPLVIPLG